MLLVGSDEHISVAIVWKKERHIEFFDSRGPNVSFKEIKEWFADQPFCDSFVNTNADFDIQSEGHRGGREEVDVYCQTWIYYYVYCRLVHGYSSKLVVRTLEELPAEARLELVKSFQQWPACVPPLPRLRFARGGRRDVGGHTESGGLVSAHFRSRVPLRRSSYDSRCRCPHLIAQGLRPEQRQGDRGSRGRQC